MTATDRFVEAMRYLSDGMDTAGEETAIQGAVEAFADANERDCPGFSHNHEKCRAALLKRVMGDDA